MAVRSSRLRYGGRRLTRSFGVDPEKVSRQFHGFTPRESGIRNISKPGPEPGLTLIPFGGHRYRIFQNLPEYREPLSWRRTVAARGASRNSAAFRRKLSFLNASARKKSRIPYSETSWYRSKIARTTPCQTQPKSSRPSLLPADGLVDSRKSSSDVSRFSSSIQLAFSSSEV